MEIDDGNYIWLGKLAQYYYQIQIQFFFINLEIS